MISRGAAHADHAVRRATAATGSAAAAWWAVALADRWTAGPSVHPLQPLADAAALLLAVFLVPVAVRVLAHPRTTPLPARTSAGVLSGLVAAVGYLVIAVVTTAVIHVFGAGGAGGAGVSVPARAALGALTGLTVVAGTLAGAQLYALRGAFSERRGPLAARPDLFDDLTLLVARTLPGGPTARSLAWLNRGLDHWSWSPRRRRAVARPSGTGATSIPGPAGALARVRPQPE